MSSRNDIPKTPDGWKQYSESYSLPDLPQKSKLVAESNKVGFMYYFQWHTLLINYSISSETFMSMHKQLLSLMLPEPLVSTQTSLPSHLPTLPSRFQDLVLSSLSVEFYQHLDLLPSRSIQQLLIKPPFLFMDQPLTNQFLIKLVRTRLFSSIFPQLQATLEHR